MIKDDTWGLLPCLGRWTGPAEGQGDGFRPRQAEFPEPER